MEKFEYYLTIAFVFLIGIFITRWVFRIDEIVENQKTTNKYLLKLLNDKEFKENNKEIL